MKTTLLLMILAFTGCTTPNMIMKSWVGHREEELYSRWGPPSRIVDNGSNGKIVMYVPDSVNKEGVKPKYINAGKPPEYLSPRVHEYKKTKLFYITPLGTIYAWKWG
jgi:hypothetical protein